MSHLIFWVALISDYVCWFSSYISWLLRDRPYRKCQQQANSSETTKTHGQSVPTRQGQDTPNIFIYFCLNCTNWTHLKQFYYLSSINHFHLFYLLYFVATPVTHNFFTYICLFHSLMFDGMKVIIYCSSDCRLSPGFFLSARNQSNLFAFLCSKTGPLPILISIYSRSGDPCSTSCCIWHYAQTQSDNSGQHSTPPQGAHR